MSVTYQVTAPLVLVTDAEGVTHHAYQGTVLDDLGKEQVDHLLELGFIAKAGSDDAVIVPGEEFLVPDTIHVPQFDAQPPEAVEPPAKVANKPEWVAFAVSQGADEAEAESLTKTELIELYGDK